MACTATRAWAIATACLAGATLASGASFTTYVDMPFNGSVGFQPQTPLVQGADGNFYGTMPNDYGQGCGSVYRLTPTGVSSLVHSFTRSAGDACHPQAALVTGPQGSLWGTTQYGGSHGSGTIYKIDARGQFSLVHSLEGFSDQPVAPLLFARDGNFYGTTWHGGVQGWGSVFRISPDGVFVELASFTASGPHQPTAGLVQTPDGNLWGTLSNGGPLTSACAFGCGGVFRLTPEGSLTTFMPFDGTTALDPVDSLTVGSDGLLYGVTPFCGYGSSCAGAAFRLDLQGRFTVLHEFTRTESPGAYPSGPLIQTADGYFYGETRSSSSTPADDSAGTVFRMTHRGAVAVVHYFALDTGTSRASWPLGGLVADRRARMLHGVTFQGGIGNNGAAFSLSR